MREIKFRAWDGKRMNTAFDLTQNPKYWWEDNKDYPLMQYTGLKDMNGVEIYEGDIFEGHKRFVVKYDEYYGGFLPFTDDGGCGCCSDGSAGQSVDTGKVIGNIHENPELLEEVE